MTPEQRAQRIHYHEYETLEGIHEHAERIVKMEELVERLYDRLVFADEMAGGGIIDARLVGDMRELGIAVDA